VISINPCKRAGHSENARENGGIILA